MTRRRLIEVAFPLEEVSAHSRREKNIRHGHISTLHVWWARRRSALRVLGQAVAECLPGGDEDRRLIFGLLGSNVRPNGSKASQSGPQMVTGRLPGVD